MKNIYIKVLGIIAITSLLLSCKKEGENIFNMFEDVTVTYHSASPLAVTDYKEVSVGDSVYLEYTINSPNQDMYMVCAFENGSGAPFIKIPLDATQRRNYSGVVKLKMDKKVGKTTYRIWALDKRGVYLGDGYKSITVEVKSNFKYLTAGQLFVAGFVDKTTKDYEPFKGEKAYFSVATGETFSYLEGAANSAKIDFGAAFLVDTTKTGDDRYTVSLYSIKANPLKGHYDVSTWTDKGTLFSAPKAGGTTFTNSLRTGEQIVEAAKKAKPTLKLATGLKAGFLFYFLTTKGEYGAVYVNYFRIVNGVPSIGIEVKTVPVAPVAP